MDVTEEMRRAVYAADCDARGHTIDVNRALKGRSDAEQWIPDVQGPDDDTVAHLHCSRCGSVWLIEEEPGVDYPDAVAKAAAKRKDPGSVRPYRPARAAGPHRH